MITKLNFAKLTPASFALANANDVDVGVGRSMLLNNIRHGREVDHIMTGLDPEYLPDWAALKPQYEALEHGGVTSAVNVWHRVCQDNYKVLVELWNENPRNCAAMAKLVESAADPGPISGPAREEWEKEPSMRPSLNSLRMLLPMKAVRKRSRSSGWMRVAAMVWILPFLS